MATGGDTRSRLRRSAGKGGEMESAGMMRWLLTYADMITLLLALFIILFAISTISKVKLQRFATAVSGGFNNVDSNNTPPDGGLRGAHRGRAEQADMAAVKVKLDRYVRANHLQAKVQTRLDKSGLVITLLSDKTYYASGSADLRPETKQLLDEIAGQIRAVKNDLRVEGSTDDVPIATSQYPTNWELSAARATGVTRYLVEHAGISPTRLSFAGYGQFRPKFPNDNEAHRHLNRRVDVVILNGTSKTNDAKDQDTGDEPTADRQATGDVPNATANRQDPGDGPSAAASSPENNVAARSAGGPHAERGGRAAGGGAPLE